VLLKLATDDHHRQWRIKRYWPAQMQAAQPLAAHGEIGNGREDESRVADRHSKPTNQLSSDSWDRILPRLARDAPEVAEHFANRMLTSDLPSSAKVLALLASPG
jgi:hypothetical protein